MLKSELTSCSLIFTTEMGANGDQSLI